jgi:hypothetical protein
MKETEVSSKDNIAIVNQKEIEKKHVKLFSIILGRSHSLWKMKVGVFLVEKVELGKHKKDITLDADLKPTETNVKLEYEEGYIYCSALNKKNAIKHFGKQMAMITTI